MKDVFKTLYKFYTTSVFYILLFFVAIAVTLAPWFYNDDGLGIWIIRVLFMIAFFWLNFTRYFMVKNYEREQSEKLKAEEWLNPKRSILDKRKRTEE